MLSKFVQRKYTLKNWVLHMSILIKMCRQNVIFFVRLFEPFQTETRKILDEWESNRTLEKKDKSNDPYQIGQSSNKNISNPEFLNKRNVVPFLFLLFSSGSFKQKFNTFKSASQSEDS